jgi:hypothetical protein
VPFDLGDSARLTATCTDPAGVAVNATGVTLTITLPDGTTASPAVTNPPATAGQYAVDYVTAQPGLHAVRWVFTGPACAYTDAMDVREAVPPALFSLADAKNKLGKQSDIDDDDLRACIEATTKCVEFFVGAVVRRTVTQIAHGGTDRMTLHTGPVLSVTSITGVSAWQLPVPVDAIDLDGAAGILRRTDMLPFWRGPYRVVYVAGRGVVGANITLAAKMILQHLWRTYFGSSRALPGVGGSDDFTPYEPIPGLGYAIPNRALQLLQGDRDHGGFA